MLYFWSQWLYTSLGNHNNHINYGEHPLRLPPRHLKRENRISLWTQPRPQPATIALTSRHPLTEWTLTRPSTWFRRERPHSQQGRQRRRWCRNYWPLWQRRFWRNRASPSAHLGRRQPIRLKLRTWVQRWRDRERLGKEPTRLNRLGVRRERHLCNVVGRCHFGLGIGAAIEIGQSKILRKIVQNQSSSLPSHPHWKFPRPQQHHLPSHRHRKDQNFHLFDVLLPLQIRNQQENRLPRQYHPVSEAASRSHQDHALVYHQEWGFCKRFETKIGQPVHPTKLESRGPQQPSHLHPRRTQRGPDHNQTQKNIELDDQPQDLPTINQKINHHSHDLANVPQLPQKRLHQDHRLLVHCLRLVPPLSRRPPIFWNNEGVLLRAEEKEQKTIGPK